MQHNNYLISFSPNYTVYLAFFSVYRAGISVLRRFWNVFVLAQFIYSRHGEKEQHSRLKASLELSVSALRRTSIAAHCNIIHSWVMMTKT